MEQPFSIFSLGDSAITIDLGNRIEEQLNNKALAIKAVLEAHPFPGLKDIIVAYSSVSVFYDPALVMKALPAGADTAYEYVRHRLEAAARVPDQTVTRLVKNAPAEKKRAELVPQAIIRIPVCYGEEYGPDLEFLAREKGISPEKVIRLHCSVIYRVYMVGFLPGFSYLGKVDAALETNRKKQPVPVMAGGVGIAGNQTGIYPLKSPGGWQIIGRTPVKLFDAYAAPPVRLAIGDQVRFFPVDKEAFLTMSLTGATAIPAGIPFETINDRQRL